MDKTYTSLTACIRDLVNLYADYMLVAKDVTEAIDSIPQIDIDRIVAVLLADADIAAEATGPDNPAWERYMLPALYRRFKTPGKSYVDMELTEEWTNGVRDYLMRYITPVLEVEITELRRSAGRETELVYDRAKEITVESARPAGY